MGQALQIEDFISRWKQSGGSERANFQTFANELLCEALDLPRPASATEAARANSYCFEHSVTFIHTGSQTRGFIDRYRAGHFVMEAKQGVTPEKPEDDAQPALLDNLPKATRKGHGTRGHRATAAGTPGVHIESGADSGEGLLGLWGHSNQTVNKDQWFFFAVDGVVV